MGYILDITDTTDGFKAPGLPMWEPWNEKAYTDGPFSTDEGRCFLFMRAQGVPTDIAASNASKEYPANQPSSKGRFEIKAMGLLKNGKRFEWEE